MYSRIWRAQEAGRRLKEVSSWQWSVVNIQGEVNRMLDTFVGRPMAGTLARGRTRLPAIDMHETRDDLKPREIKIDIQ